MTNKTNEEIIYAPIEIESADQLHALGATWDDCRTWRIGARPVTVFLVPADRETRDFLIQDLRQKYEHYSRRTRCKIPGTRKQLVTCPESNHCDQCPFGMCREEREPETISLDAMLEEGFEPMCEDTIADYAETSLELERVLKKLYAMNPDYVRLVTMRAQGYTVDEIVSLMHISRATLFRMLRQIRRIAENIA